MSVRSYAGASGKSHCKYISRLPERAGGAIAIKSSAAMQIRMAVFGMCAEAIIRAKNCSCWTATFSLSDAMRARGPPRAIAVPMRIPFLCHQRSSAGLDSAKVRNDGKLPARGAISPSVCSRSTALRASNAG